MCSAPVTIIVPECFVAVAREHLPEVQLVQSRAHDELRVVSCSLQGTKQGNVCLAGLLLVFPSPNLYVIRNLYVMEDTLDFR